MPKFKRVHRKSGQITPHVMAMIQEYPQPTKISGGFYSYRGFYFIQTHLLTVAGWKSFGRPDQWCIIPEEKFNLHKQTAGKRAVRDTLYECTVYVTMKLGVHKGVNRIDNPIYPKVHGNALANRIRHEKEKILRQDLLDLEY